MLNTLIGKAWRQEFEPKLFSSLRKGYSWSTLQKDFYAGITVAIVAFPLAMALAVASGSTPDRGLFTAIIAGIIIAMFGGSRTQIGGPTAAFVVVIFDVISRHGYEGLVITTLMAGVLLIIAGIARLGSIIKYIPYSVITGFTSGLAVVVFTSQLRDFFGLDIGTIPAAFIDKVAIYYQNALTVDFETMVLGGSALGSILLIRRFFPKVPVLLFVVTATSLAVWLFGLDVATISSKYGAIPARLPVPTLPTFTMNQLIVLFPEAVTIAFLAGVESLLCAVIADGMTGDRHRSNAELIAQGIANLLTPLFGGLPATATFSRTATNIKAGARTPISGIIQSLLILGFMLALAPLASMIPLAALASILIVVAFDMSDMSRFTRIVKGPRGDALLVVVTFVLTIVANLTVAIQTGIILAALLFVQRMSRLTQITPSSQNDHEQHDNLMEGNDLEETLPENVCLYHISGPFFFGAASRLRFILEQVEAKTKVYILNFVNVPMIDATGAQVIRQFTQKCHRKSITVIICGLSPQTHDSLTGIGLSRWVPRKHRVVNIHAAIILSEKIVQTAMPPADAALKKSITVSVDAPTPGNDSSTLQ